MDEYQSVRDVPVWLPTFNEEPNIVKMISDLRQLGFLVFVTDGGSTDKTVELAQKAGIKVFMRPGEHKGYGIIRALELSAQMGYKYMAYVDCDQTYPVDRLPEMCNLALNNDLVIGARDFNKIHLLSRLGNHLFTWLINFAFSAQFKDTQSGMRVLNISKFIGKLKATEFDFEAEMCCYAAKNGLTVKDLPVNYYERVGESKIAHITDGLLILKRIIFCKFFD